MNPALGITLVLAALGALIGGVALAQHLFGLRGEVARKSVHVGMGLVCCAFPWIFPDPRPVILLAVLAIAGLAAVRFLPPLRARFGGVLGGVERRSLGEFYFPAAVAAVFVLANGDALLFLIPVLTLTLADTTGALIGLRYGLSPYRTDEGTKSTEGSFALFTTAFLTVHIPLLLFSDAGRAECLFIGLTAGFIVMLLEAISWRGQDNLIIPLGLFVLLKLFLPLDAAALALRFGVAAALVVFVWIWRSRTTLSDSAVLAGALAGYALWAFGGWLWLAPPVVLFLVYVLLPGFPGPERPMQNLHAVSRVMAGGFLWLLCAVATKRPELVLPAILGLAAHTGNIITARLRVVRPQLTRPIIGLIAAVLATALFEPLVVAAAMIHDLPLSLAATTPLAVGISVTAFLFAWPTAHTSENVPRVWLSETLIAIVASLIGLAALVT